MESLNQKNIDNIVPELSGKIAVYPFDDSTFLVHEKQYDFYVRINGLTNDLLKMIDGKRTIKELVQIVYKKNNTSLQSADLYKILYGKLAENGIIKSDKAIAANTRGDYLKFRIPLFKEQYVYKISHLLSFLFVPSFFYYSLLVMLLFVTPVFINNLSWEGLYEAITPRNLLFFYSFSLFVTLLHELGHATACRKFGASHGDIGMAFYLFMPVFYADVSDAWKLKSKERVIIDMAGLYLEILVAFGLSVAFLLTKDLILLILAFYVIVHTYSNLNPLLRYDAYWALSDFFNIPNLRKDSNQKLSLVVKSLLKREYIPLKTKRDYFLTIYGLLSVSFVVIFLVVLLFINAEAIFYLPVNLFLFFKSIILNWSAVTFEGIKSQLANMVLPISFYIVSISLFFKSRGKWKNLFNF